MLNLVDRTVYFSENECSIFLTKTIHQNLLFCFRTQGILTFGESSAILSERDVSRFIDALVDYRDRLWGDRVSGFVG